MLRRISIALLIASVAAAVSLPAFACAMPSGRLCPARMSMPMGAVPAGGAGVSCHCALDRSVVAAIAAPVVAPAPTSDGAAVPAAPLRAKAAAGACGDAGPAPVALQSRLCTFLI